MGVSLPIATSIASQVAQSASPKKGGHFIFGSGHGSTTDDLDPAKVENDNTIATTWAFRGHLTEVSNTDELIGDLAESWEVTPDASTWIFKLRDGVEFHNGKTLDANDVVASINYHRGEDSASAAKPIIEGIEEITATGKNEVTIKLSSSNADFPYIVSDYHLAIMASDGEGNVDWQDYNGTGGYKLENFDPGVTTSLTRNPNFYKENRAHFDSIEILTIADTLARTTALGTGEIHMMDRCDLKTVKFMKKNKDISVKETSGTAHYTIPMLTNVAPFDNNDLRLALKHGVDREVLLKTILNGHGVVGNDHPIGRSNQYHADDLEQRTYDPDKANFYLKKAGHDSITVNLVASDAAFSGAVDAAILYKEQASKAGINIDVVRSPADGYWAAHWIKSPWIMSYWSGRPTEDWMFATAYASGAAWNETAWEHEKFNKLMLEGRAELDKTKRRAIYYEMQAILRNEGGSVIPMFNNYVFAARSNVQHGQLSAAWPQDGQKAFERWWFS
ncbi:MAG: ABC transporter substrate-binding protein [Rhodospirillales bacterium]|nr:ABC transporter substrate-binding protein [Rhodospirillales bacterium]